MFRQYWKIRKDACTKLGMFFQGECVTRCCTTRKSTSVHVGDKSDSSKSLNSVIAQRSDTLTEEETQEQELNVGERTDDVTLKQWRLTSVDMWALGITIVIGGQYFAWNAGLSVGFGSYLIATVLIGSAYVCLILCLAELSSALPFAGNNVDCIHKLHL